MPAFIRCPPPVASRPRRSGHRRARALPTLALVVLATLLGSGGAFAALTASQSGIVWQARLGGNCDDGATCLVAMPDGGVAVAGFANSRDGDIVGHHDGDVSAHWGRGDVLVARYDAAGKRLWHKVYGGRERDVAWAIDLAADGNLWIAGFTCSTEGDVSGQHGGQDAWLLKVSASSGSLLWRRAYGGNGDEVFHAVRGLADGSCLLAGATNSPDGDVVGGKIDDPQAWVLRLAGDGAIVWQKLLGKRGDDAALALDLTGDGGCLVAGRLQVGPWGEEAPNALAQLWTARLDANGVLLWERVAGGTDDDVGHAVRALPDGSALVAGLTHVYTPWPGTPTTATDPALANQELRSLSDPDHAGAEAWLLGFDAKQQPGFSRNYGGTGDDLARGLRLIGTTGCLLIGETDSANGEPGLARRIDQNHRPPPGSGHEGPPPWRLRPDAWLLALDLSGKVAWQRIFGGVGDDRACDAVPTPDGAWIFAGQCSPLPGGDGDVASGSFGLDLWVVKFRP